MPISLAGYPDADLGPTDVTAFGGNVVFDGGITGGQSLWTIDATSGGASPVTTAALSPDLDPLNFAVTGNTLFFSGTDGSGSRSLYVSDGTTAGTHLVGADNASAGGLSPDEIVAASGRVFFSGIDAGGSSNLWVSDGTTAGTQALVVANTDTQNISNMGVGLNPANITVANSQLFFAGTDASGAVGLWKSDGTGSGTTELNIGGAAAGGIDPTTSNIVSFNNLTYFAGRDASGNVGLWVTDGTGADTTELTIANSSASGLGPVSLTVFDSALYFGGTDASGNIGLWKSDGTAAGTTELVVSGTASAGLDPVAYSALDYPNVAMKIFNNKLYFEGSGPDGTNDLWTSDGTGAGTVQVSTLDAASTGVLPTDFTVFATPGLTIAAPTLSSAVAPLTLGTGHDTITLVASEDAYLGDAQFTISVDGKQIGGIQTETAQTAQSQSQVFTLYGDWGDGTHSLTLDFLNDAYGGTAALDRNLYIKNATYNGIPEGGSLSLLNGGSQTLTLGTIAPGITTLGAGSDSIMLQMSEDMFLGNAQFTVEVDGQQIGGTQTVSASHAGGQAQQFNVLGSFGAGPHTVGVDFINDAVGTSALQDRNLYLNSIRYDGTLVAGGSLVEMSGGTQSLVVNAPPVVIPAILTVGAGYDTIALQISEDNYLGDAKFTVAVDGKQVGGTLSAQDAHSASLDQTLDILGNFGGGSHQVTVDFLNDATASSIAAGDRNLYVDGASYDGVTMPGVTLALLSSGPQKLAVGVPASSSTTWIGTGYDMIGLNLSEDFFQGNAQFTVSVDGLQIGGTQIASASHSTGQEQTLDLFGSFGAGQHTISVNFLNDAYAGSATTDRNLYLDGSSYNGVTAGGTLSLMGAGAQLLVVGTATQASVRLGSGADTIALAVSEDYFRGDAQFTLAVDGVQIGGVQVASAQHSSGLDTIYDLAGNFGSGQHIVAVTFLNDAAGPDIATEDRNLYVDSAAYDGNTIEGARLSVLSTGTQDLTVGTAVQDAISLGSGLDTISLRVSEDFFQGNAQFIAVVDGVQIGDVQTASAQRVLGQDTTYNLFGNFGPGQHKVSITFLNDTYGGSAAADRNLYIDGASYDGFETSGTTLSLLNNGTQGITVGNPSPAVTTLGSGADTIGLKVSEDFFQGDAQFTISVDGKQIGGVQIAGAQHGAGQDQTFNVLGDFGPASHVVTVDFLNDAYGNGLDRNVYVDATTFDGRVVFSGSGEIPSAVPGSVSIPGTDTLTLTVSEDAFQGDAQYTVSVDGHQVGGVLTASASHAAGQTQTVNLIGSWGLGPHVIGTTFLNDAYGDGPSQDRNLYVASAAINGATTVENIEQPANGTAYFMLATATTYAPGDGGGSINTLGNDTVNAGAGAVVVSANGPTGYVVGGAGAMTFFGGTGTNTVIGGSGAVTLTDSGGSLAFTAGSGKTTINAGANHELYNIINGHAGNLLDLYGFNPTNDRLHLQGFSGTGINSQQTISGSTQIVLADTTKIILHNVTGLSDRQIFS